MMADHDEAADFPFGKKSEEAIALEKIVLSSRKTTQRVEFTDADLHNNNQSYLLPHIGTKNYGE